MQRKDYSEIILKLVELIDLFALARYLDTAEHLPEHVSVSQRHGCKYRIVITMTILILLNYMHVAMKTVGRVFEMLSLMSEVSY